MKPFSPDGAYAPLTTALQKPPALFSLAGRLLPPLCILATLLLGGCAGSGGSVQAAKAVPSAALATEGPSLALVGEYSGMRLEGYMDRTCMAGYGSLGLRAVGQYRRGDMAVEMPALPDAPQHTALAADMPTASGPSSRLALAAYPARKSQASGQAGTVLKPSPTAAAPKASARDGGLRLASYPQDEPAPPPDSRMPEEKGHELLPNSPLLRTQSANAAEYESSVPVAVEFVCEAKVDAPPTNKARIRGVLHCSGNRQMLFSLRNTGPDQGVGVGKETEDGSLMVLFYHSSMEEARRRFPSVRQDILYAQQQQQ